MRNINHLILSIVLMFCGIPGLKAYHIIGGTVTYDCLGNDRYKITFIMYRDCSRADAADFDSAPGSPPATVTVWKEDISVPFIPTITLDPPKVTRLNPSTKNPCKIIPPNICVEKGVYTFIVTLPQSTSSYHIVYQRCCRNITIANIQHPNDVGATYHVEITPEAQASCIDSPVFNSYPPVVICSGYPLVVDQSVHDNDPGTIIRYSLCAPFIGGGRQGVNQGENRFAPNGLTPNPDTRPPFDFVEYTAGFSAQNPLIASPPLTIDPVTGVITGTPTALGQYVVGICVEQIKNGKTIALIKRDFQFNIVECIPKVQAKIRAEKTGKNEYLILQCGDRTVNIINESTDENFIETYEWTVNVNGTQEVFHKRDLTYTFPDTGVYQVKMLLNKGLKACTDSALIKVEVRNAIFSKHRITGEVCDAYSVDVINNSYSENGPISSYFWNLGEGYTSTQEDPEVKYPDPGYKDVFLVVADEYGCVDTSFSSYAFFPRPVVVDIELIQDLLCTRTSINVNNNSYPIDSTYQVNWYLSNGDVYEGVEPIFTFDEAGTQDLIVEIISPLGCVRTDTFNNFFDVLLKPTAMYDYEPKELSQFVKTVDFINLSLDADDYKWQFDEDGMSMEYEPVFTFPDTGYKEVTLYAISDNGCRDTITKILDVVPLATYFLPNAFTPDGDGLNDGYRGTGWFPFIDNFKMMIFTRWGEKVYETTDPQASWNGRYQNTGKRLPQGVYVVKVRFTDPRGNVIVKESFATLLD